MTSRLRIAGLTVVVMVMVLSGCTMSEERLVDQMSNRMAKLKGYYAELDAVVYSPEGEQQYHVKQWVELPSRWRIEVSFDDQLQVFLCDGEQIWVYEEGYDEYFRFTADHAGEMPPPFMMLSFMQELSENTQREYHGQEKQEDAQFYAVSYVDSTYQETVRLWLDKKNLFPMRVDTYLDNGELLNRITCTTLELNPSFEESLFQFAGTPDSEVVFKCLVTPLSVDEARHNWPIPLYMPDYLPEGARLFSITRSVEQDREQLIMVFDGVNSFTFIQKEKTGTPLIKTAGMEEIRIGEAAGLYQKNLLDGLQTLWWSNETSDFVLTGTLPQLEMVKIARSLKEQ